MHQHAQTDWESTWPGQQPQASGFGAFTYQGLLAGFWIDVGHPWQLPANEYAQPAADSQTCTGCHRWNRQGDFQQEQASSLRRLGH